MNLLLASGTVVFLLSNENKQTKKKHLVTLRCVLKGPIVALTIRELEAKVAAYSQQIHKTLWYLFLS